MYMSKFSELQVSKYKEISVIYSQNVESQR